MPEGVIIVKGAWSSASDSVTPLPEGASVSNGVLSDPYFGITYPLPKDWWEKRKGPPPSDSGRYLLSLITPTPQFKGASRGNIVMTADDMFFTPLPASSASQLINFTRNHLEADYQVELKPTQTIIAGRTFTFFAYWSPVAELHWYVLATEIRCHIVQIVMTSQDTKLLESLILDLNKMKLPPEAGLPAGVAGRVPVCIKDYANQEHLIERVEPVFSERRFNPVPVRIIIDEEGKVKHIHFLSAFPEQAKAITDALGQWKFRPYVRDGQPVEVETGIMFGRGPRPAITAEKDRTTD
ncbi:MAG TPA: energy transducer TonB [Terriglobales bacterium]